MHVRPASADLDHRLSVPDPVRGSGHLPLPWLLGLLGTLAASAFLPGGGPWRAALTVIILLGVPHGALDGEVARPVLRPRLGPAWFALFALPYLGLSATVLLAWHLAPEATLATFLAASAWHFGEEDAGQGSWPDILVRGGLPIAVPVLLHPAETAHVFGTAAGVPLASIPAWLAVPCWAWLALALTRVRRGPVATEMACLAAVFALLPPLTAFAFYFVGFHAPRHMAELVSNPLRAPRVQAVKQAVIRSLPVTGLTLALGALLWPLYSGPAPDRLLALTLQGLAALTLPHLLLSHAPVERWSVRPASR